MAISTLTLTSSLYTRSFRPTIFSPSSSSSSSWSFSCLCSSSTDCEPKRHTRFNAVKKSVFGVGLGFLAAPILSLRPLDADATRIEYYATVGDPLCEYSYAKSGLGLAEFSNGEGSLLRCTGKFQGETVSEETSTGVNEFGVEKRDAHVVAVEESEAQAEDEQTQSFEFLNDVKLDSDNTYSILLYGSRAVVALYLTSAVVGSLESVPLFPKLMEVVGLGYTLWFTTRYLLFKRNREELKTKISEIKKQVLGSDSD